MLGYISDKKFQTYFAGSVFLPLVEWCRRHDLSIQAFIEILKYQPQNQGVFLIGALLEMEELILRLGMDVLVRFAQRYPRAYEIMHTIKGEGITFHEGPKERTEYRHSLMAAIQDPETFELYAAHLDSFLEATDGLESRHFCSVGVFVEKYGIENLPALGRIARTLGDTAFRRKSVWVQGKEEIMAEVEMFLEENARALLYRFSLDDVADLVEATRGNLKGVNRHITALEEEYPEPIDRLAAVKTLHRNSHRAHRAQRAPQSREPSTQEKDLPLGSEDVFAFIRPEDPIQGIFGYEGNRRLFSTYGVEAMARLLESLDRLPDRDFFAALAAFAPLATSENALQRWGHAIGNTHHVTRAVLPHYVHVIPDENALADFDARVRRLYDFDGDGPYLEARLEEAAPTIDRLEGVDTVVFKDEAVKNLMRRHGFEAFASIVRLIPYALCDRKPRDRFLQLISRLDPALQDAASLAQIAPLATAIRNESVMRALASLSIYPKNVEGMEELVTALNRIVDVCLQEKDPKKRRDPKEVFKEILRAIPHFTTVEDVVHTAEAWSASIEARQKITEEYAERVLFGESPEERVRNKTSKDYVLRALYQAPKGVFQCMDPTLRLDPEVALEAVRRWEGLFPELDPSLRNDPDFQRRAFEANFNVCNRIAQPPAEMKARYDAIVESLKSLNISFPTRFNTRTVEAILANRLQIGALDPARVALMVYPKDDHNKAFEMNLIDSLMDEGWSVLYFEMGTTADGQALLADLEALAGRERIPVLELGAHSCITHMSFGTADPDFPDRARVNPDDGNVEDVNDTDSTLDIFRPTEGLAPIVSALRCYLSPQLIGIVSGCSTGGGADQVMNVANFLAALFPGSTWLSPTVPTREMGYVFERRNGLPSLPTGVLYPNGSLYRAHRPPATSA